MLKKAIITSVLVACAVMSVIAQNKTNAKTSTAGFRAKMDKPATNNMKTENKPVLKPSGPVFRAKMDKPTSAPKSL
ncbi:MAG: hypothetical protein JSS96_08815 [Bacteroidetes bacterium]|nr:hypothetical protein [Bacteroidota bacterium]